MFEYCRGSERFAMLIGLAKTFEGIGASFSNLLGEIFAEHLGYGYVSMDCMIYFYC